MNSRHPQDIEKKIQRTVRAGTTLSGIVAAGIAGGIAGIMLAVSTDAPVIEYASTGTFAGVIGSEVRDIVSVYAPELITKALTPYFRRSS